MPKRARPIPTPGEGDCFFHAVAHNLVGLVRDRDAALAVRRAIAGYLAQNLYRAPYDDLATLTGYVLAAQKDEDFYYYRLPFQTASRTVPAPDGNGTVTRTETAPEAAELQRLWYETLRAPGVANGQGCPLAAWVVWLQYDEAEIAVKRTQGLGFPGLRQTRFLDYVLWGDTILAAHAAEKLHDRKVIVYTDTDNLENLDEENPISLYHTSGPDHFSAVRFVDPAEVERWEETCAITVYGPGADPLNGKKTCPRARQAREETPTLILVDPDAVVRHVSQPRSTSTQYTVPPMQIPQKKDALDLLKRMLEGTAAVMGRAGRCTSTERIDFATFSNPPVYVVSSNRSYYIGQVFWSGVLFASRLVKAHKQAKRAVIFMVDEAEAPDYRKALAVEKTHVQGLYVMACSGGFGMSWSRHCALLHARRSGFKKAWVFDDNVDGIGSSGTDPDVDDSLLEGVPTFSYSKRTPLIMERGVGFNLELLTKMGNLNFCPYFAYNKDDRSLEEVLRQRGFDYLDYPHPVWKNERPGLTKVDKGSFPADTDRKLTGSQARVPREKQIAQLDIWRDTRKTTTAVEVLKLITGKGGPRDVMKWQADVMWTILCHPAAAEAFASWFTDGVVEIEFSEG